MRQGKLHLLAWGVASAVVTDSILTAIADPLYSRQNNQFQIPEDLNLHAVYGSDVNLTRMRINTPSLRLMGFPQVIPFNSTLLPPNDPNVADFRDWPIRLRREENLEIDFTGGNAAPANVYAGAWVSDPSHNLNVPSMDRMRWLRFTASLVNVAFTWSALGTITFQDSLEGGSYNVYGMQVSEATNIFARLSFQNQYCRPGCIGQALVGSRGHEMFRGGLGFWGEFNTYSLPQIEVIGNTAGAATIEGMMLVSKSDGFQPPYNR